MAGTGTFSAFSSSTSNSGNNFSAGTVTITDNDLDVAALSLSGAKPNDSDTSCLKVIYTGSLASNVRLYATVTGTLAPYLNVVVTRGTNTSPFGDCTNFSADPTNYIGQGNGVVYSGLLSAFPSTWAAGVVDAPGAVESWATSEEHDYRFVVTLADNNAAQGLSSGATFTWEAQNT